MSDPKNLQLKQMLPAGLEAQLKVLGNGSAPIFIRNFHNNGGVVNVGENYIQTTMITEPQQKIMFQVENPVHSFTGREEFVQELHASIQKCRKESSVSIISQTFCITGPAGVGKSETVKKYVSDFSSEYASIIWINAEAPSKIIDQFTTIANCHLNLNTTDVNDNSLEFSYILDEVYAKLCSQRKQLLIVFNNADALDYTSTHPIGIRQFLPEISPAYDPPVVFITSRIQCWEDMNVLTLGLWEIEECIGFIYKRLHLEETPENRKDATDLAELFDRLPIATEVATSVIAERSRKKRVRSKRFHSIKNLIAEYRAGNRKMLSRKTQQNSTLMTMQILLTVSLDKIKACTEGGLAIKILAFMVFLFPTRIPKKMINALLVETKAHERTSALILLVDYSLIQNFKTHFQILRVFQDIIIEILPGYLPHSFEVNNYGVEEKVDIKILRELTSRILDYKSDPTLTDDDCNEAITSILHVTDYIVQNCLIQQFKNYFEEITNFLEKRHLQINYKVCT